MENPHWRSVTVIPNRSDKLDDFLKTIGEGNLSNKDRICSHSLSPFNESTLPFCCTLVGWSTDKGEDLLQMLTDISQITTLNGEDISSDGVSTVTDFGTIAIVGVYPLLDITDSTERGEEYKSISFMCNNDILHTLLNDLHSFCFRGAMQTDDLGFFISVLAESDEIAQQKLEELIANL